MMGHKGKIFCALSKTQNMCSWPPKGRNFVAYHRHKRRALLCYAVIHPLVPVASYTHTVIPLKLLISNQEDEAKTLETSDLV